MSAWRRAGYPELSPISCALVSPRTKAPNASPNHVGPKSTSITIVMGVAMSDSQVAAAARYAALASGKLSS